MKKRIEGFSGTHPEGIPFSDEVLAEMDRKYTNLPEFPAVITPAMGLEMTEDDYGD